MAIVISKVYKLQEESNEDNHVRLIRLCSDDHQKESSQKVYV